ncbi:MAG TPA: hypothetical protein VGB17_05030 [Pyrinomonadaceae bacterium]|jgi:tetratricopeptide (TPR) repeat protein
MKLSQARFALLLLIVVVAFSGCGVINRIRSKNELNEAARTYREGHFAEAEQHSKRAMELDPDNKTAPSFVARTIHAQYKPGNETPENVAKAREAIEAYKQMMEKNPNSKEAEEAYKAIAALYGAIKEEDTQRQWIMQRANSNDAKPEQRAEAWVVLASKDWNCSFQITELPASKQVVKEGNKALIVYKKPPDQKDYDQAHACVQRGLEEAEKAISFDPTNESAWSYKTNLLREAAKLAEMDGKTEDKDKLSKQAEEAQQQTTKLSEENQKKKEAQEAQKQPAKKAD